MQTTIPPRAREARRQAEARALELLARLKKGGARQLPEGVSAVDWYLILTHENLTCKEQAAQLGADPGSVSYWRRRLYAQGRLTREGRRSHAPITDAEAAAVGRLFLQGYSHERIAEMRQIAKIRVLRCLERSGARGQQRERLWTARQLCQMFGVAHHTIRDFVARGWLPAQRSGVERGGQYGWTRADLFALMACRESWVAYGPAQLPDAELAAHTRRCREAAGGRWWARQELGALVGLRDATVSMWADAGYLDGLPANAWGPLRFVWLTHRQAQELEALAAPIRAVAGRGGPAVRRVTNQLRPALLAALRGPEQRRAA